ncbi:MAG: SDR family oxidoreductase [SAR202 cluster bacterium]|jgi:NAD(P)-dependent dehydrogenase (short-subunit alcohol dehydrogenase family)|nr:SDR family oxidoreductase [SAR202 cluster bacterium]MDP6513936.1 SDR family oxidoreductase [SAR202 cluster bacterium]MDP6713543.1 SDR family oxidoreductase [SAR202 cluster bacterium]
MRLDGKVAFITGGGRGIGRHVGLAFAREGAKIAVTGRTKERRDQVVTEIQADGGEAQAFNLDVTKDESVFESVKQVLEVWGQIDILVNSAGIIQYNTPVESTTIEEWDTMMNINLRGTFLVCHAVVPSMIERGSGTVINLGSSAGRMADEVYGGYTASKWGVVGYTTSLARSVRPHGIRVNGLNPGWVDTDMSRDFDPKGDPEWSTPLEIANAALYLATDAPRDMTGQFLDIFGS